MRWRHKICHSFHDNIWLLRNNIENSVMLNVCVVCVCVCVCVQVDAALGRVDEVVEDLLLGLKERDIYDCVNVIIVSDHGEGEIRHGGQKLNLSIVHNLK